MLTDRHERIPLMEARQDEDGGIQADTNTRLAWMRTRMALERTMMAWNRTSLSLIGFGFTIYQFLKKVEEASDTTVLRSESPRNFGLAFIALGTLGTLIALWQHHLVAKYLRGPEFKGIVIEEHMPRASLSVVITMFLTVIGIVTGISVALDA